MSMIDPTTGLRTPIRLTPAGQGQLSAFGNLFNAAGTPTFNPVAATVPTPPPSTFTPSSVSAFSPRPVTPIGAQMGRAVGNVLVSNPGASGAARFLAPGATLGKLASRAGVGAFAGQIGSGLIDRTNIGGQNSNLEQGLQGAAIGAGVGAGVGSVVPVLGTGLGAAAGGLIGGAAGVIGNLLGGGDDKGKEQQEFASRIDAALSDQGRASLYRLAGVDADTQSQIDRGVAVQMALLDRQRDDLSDEEFLNAKAQIAAQVEQAVLSYAANPPAPTPPQPAQMTPQDIAAMQMTISQFMQPHVDATERGGELAANALRSMGAGSQADLAQSGASRLAHAYAAQSQLIPMMGQLQQAQSQWAQFAQQQQARQMAGQGAGGGGTGDFEQLLAQLGAAEG